MFDVDHEMIEKYGIDDHHDLPLEDKLAFVNEQISQVQKITWRLRFDIMVLTDSHPETEDEEVERDKKLREYKKDLGGYVKGLSSFHKVLEGLQ